jgi:large subunit ribosomal protein L35
MPKMKTHKGAAKRFRFTGSGKVVQIQGRRGHFRRRKANRVLQRLDKTNALSEANRRIVSAAMPYGGKYSR